MATGFGRVASNGEFRVYQIANAHGREFGLAGVASLEQVLDSDDPHTIFLTAAKAKLTNGLHLGQKPVMTDLVPLDILGNFLVYQH